MNDYQKLKPSIAVAGALALASGGAMAVPVYGTNLIVDGDAETGPESNGNSTAQVVPGFASTGPFNEV